MIGNLLPVGHVFAVHNATDDELKAIVSFLANPFAWWCGASGKTGFVEVDNDLVVAAIGELSRRKVLP